MGVDIGLTPRETWQDAPWSEYEEAFGGSSSEAYAEPGEGIQDPYAFASRVEREADRIRIRDAARALVDAEQRPALELPPLRPLGAFLAEPDEPVMYRVEGLWPARGRVVLAAPHKAGKSTLVGNLLRALADGSPFLDRFTTEQARRVVLLDDELDPGMIRRWLRDQDITNDAAVLVIALRGCLSTFNILDPAVRASWARHIGPADVLILDCLRPVLDAIGLDENHEAGRFLEAFDELLAEAGIGEAVVIHHTGHAGERSRGDSRILDWPDAVWSLTRDKTDEDTGVGSADRYFSAYGRDVDQPQALLGFDPITRRLHVAGGSRSDVRTDAALEAVAALLADSAEPLSGRQIEDAMTENSDHPRSSVRAALRRGVQLGMIITEDGPRRSKLHFLNPSAPVRRSAPPVRRRTGDECAAHSIEGALTAQSTEHSSALEILPPGEAVG